MEVMNRNIGSIPVEYFTTAASLATLVYEYLLTLDSEVERFWKGFYHQRTWSSFLFFLNRYLALFGYIPFIFWFAHQTTRSQCILIRYNMIFSPLLLSIIMSMMLLRIYALYERRVQTLVFPAIISVCTLSIGITGIIQAIQKDPSGACSAGVNREFSYYIIGASGGELLFDITIFTMTLRKVLTLPRGSGYGLLAMIMRDGTVYFGVMITFNLANLIVLTLADATNSAAMINPMTIVSSIMMTRLMLNLRDPRLLGGKEEYTTTTMNIHGFNGLTQVEKTNDDARNVHQNEGSF